MFYLSYYFTHPIISLTVYSGITEKDTSYFQNTSFNGSFSGDLDTSTGGPLSLSPSRVMVSEDRAAMSFSTDVDSSTASAEDTKDLMGSPMVCFFRSMICIIM